MAFSCSVPALLSVFLVLPELAHAQTPCFITDQEYVGKTLILPGYPRSPEGCQNECRMTYLCEFFTFKAKAVPNQHGPSACLKYGFNVTLQPVEGNETGVTSGPVRCPTTTVFGTTLTLPSASGNATVAPVIPTYFPSFTTLVPGFPTDVPTTINDTNLTNSTNGTIIDGGNEGGGFPWWAILLLALVVLGVLAVVLYGGCGDDKSKKKKKNKSKKGSKEARGASTEMGPEVEAPLVTGQAPAPVQEAAPSPPLPPPVSSQMAGGSVQVAGSPVAEPVTTMSGTYPMGSSGQQVVYAQPGQQMYMQPQQVTTIQMPMMSVQQQARQPVFR